MHSYYLFYTIITLTAAGILFALSVYAWYRRNVPGGIGFFWMLTVCWGWMLFWALELISQDLTLKSFFNNVRYSFALFATFSTVVFLLQFTRRTRWLHPRHLLLLGFVPLIGLLLIWTNPLHHLVWQEYQIEQSGAFLLPIRRYGAWFYVQTGYNQAMILIELFLLTHAIIFLRPPYRFQAFIILIAISSVLVADIFWLLRLIPGLSLYPFSLVISGLLITWALFRYRLLDLIPVSHRVLIENMHDSLLVLDHQSRVVDLNPSAQRLTGLTTRQAIGQRVLAVLPPHPLWRMYLETEQVVHVDIVYTQQGDTHVYDAQIAPLHDRRGELTGRFIVLRDITERKGMEQSLRASEERFRMLAENARHIIFRMQFVPERRFEYISPAVTTIMGYTPDEVYADPDLYLRAAHAESRSLLLSLAEVDRTSGEPVMVHYMRKDGREIWVEHEHWSIYDADGRRVAVEGVVRDVTGRKQAEQQRDEQQEALIMLRERERLARELHDSLGQVLGYVNMQSQAVRDRLRLADVAQAMVMLDQITDVSQQVLADIREYILGVQISAINPQPTPDVPAAQAFFTALRTYLQEFTHLAEIETHLDLPPELEATSFAPTVETHLLRIIQEALTNVRKHAHATHAVVRFARLAPESEVLPERPGSSAEDPRRWLTVTIEDNGQGFLAPDPGHETVTDKGGYGLISMRGRAEECGGSLSLGASPTGGTSVIVRIPLRRQSDIVYHPLRVLLVDDNPLFLLGLTSLLSGRGFQVVGTAGDGYAAIEQARRLQPNMILMDVQMPNCDGLAATRAIKQAQPEVQIVMLTVSEDETHLFESLKNGASGYLLKSLDGDDLCALLRGLLHGETPISPSLAQKVLHEFAHQESTPLPPEATLPDQQVQILRLVAQGLTYREVGERLNYAESTIKKHMGQIMRQLHLKNRADAVEYARRTGL